MKLLVDTNIVIDCLQERHPFGDSARMLLLLGKLHELDLWLSVSQLTDAFYILSEGGKRSLASEAKRQLLGVLQCARICSLGEDDAKAALESSWDDVEDACVYQAALRVKADAIITRNKQDFEKSSIKVFDCDELFAYLEEEEGLAYGEIFL